MSTNRDLELGAALQELPTPEHNAGFWEELEERLAGEPPVQRLSDLRTRRFKPRTMWLLSAAAAVALVIAAVVVLPGDEKGTELRVTQPTTPKEPAGWNLLPDGPLSARSEAVSVWTGRVMLVWGGQDTDGQPLGDGAAYDPSARRWKSMADAPTGPLFAATAVWTGSGMLVWGGSGGSGAPGSGRATGASYDPSSDRWTPISDAPLDTVAGHSAVWTGQRMLIWGGSVGESPVADGASYDPATDKWAELPRAPISPRFDHTVVWAGDRMIVWGGFSGEESSSREALGDGASYDPATNRWTPLPAAPIEARAMHRAVWTGSAMVVWGGTTNSAGLVSDGAAFDPSSNRWTPLPPAPLSSRLAATMVQAGDGVLVWGGAGENGDLSDGAVLALAAGSWSALPDGPLAGRSRHTAVWTGSSMLVWGGLSAPPAAAGQVPLADGAEYRPDAVPAD